jgi:hypothetical protein
MFYHLHNICVRSGIAPLTNKDIILRQARDVPLTLSVTLNIYVMKMFGILTSICFPYYCVNFSNKSLFTIPGFDII